MALKVITFKHFSLFRYFKRKAQHEGEKKKKKKKTETEEEESDEGDLAGKISYCNN